VCRWVSSYLIAYVLPFSLIFRSLGIADRDSLVFGRLSAVWVDRPPLQWRERDAGLRSLALLAVVCTRFVYG
jgi:hypothetical protein